MGGRSPVRLGRVAASLLVIGSRGRAVATGRRRRSPARILVNRIVRRREAELVIFFWRAGSAAAWIPIPISLVVLCIRGARRGM